MNNEGSRKIHTPLTTRQVAIIKLLLKKNSVMTTKEIAENLHVSIRTVYRDLEVASSWLVCNNFSIVRKPGIGIYLDMNKKLREELKARLETEQAVTVLGKEERRRRLISQLRYSKEPLSISKAAEIYCVSRGTVSNDIKAINSDLKNDNIMIIVSKGKGMQCQCIE